MFVAYCQIQSVLKWTVQMFGHGKAGLYCGYAHNIASSHPYVKSFLHLLHTFSVNVVLPSAI